jgi:ATP-dependent DNA helicase RecG
MSAEELNVPDEELLNKLGVLVDGRLTRAGVLLFTENHFSAQTATYTKVGMFGEGRADLLYQDTFDGSLINTASKILDVIFLKYLRASITYEHGQRIETYPFEYDAVREGIYNALVHNVYMTGTPIQIRIDEHSIEISNSCILPEDWTVDSLMESHKSEPYNPSIANVFYRMGYIENWGRGIEKIVAACERLGAPRPEYKVIGYGITLYLHALETAVIRDAKGSELASNDTLSGGTDSEEFRRVPKSSEDSTFALTESEESVYTYLLNKGSARTSEIANAVALTPRGTLKVLKRLEEKRLVHAEGSTSSRVYRTTSI